MFCAFEGPPNIVRLHGTGRYVALDDAEFDSYRGFFADHPGARGVVVVDVDRVSDSCGYAVPLMSHEGDRDLLTRWADNRGDEGLATYRATKNATSIDGLPALDPSTAAPSSRQPTDATTAGPERDPVPGTRHRALVRGRWPTALGDDQALIVAVSMTKR